MVTATKKEALQKKITKDELKLHKGRKPKSLLYNRSDTLSFWIMCAPCIIWTLIFCYGPMVGIVLAFKDFNYAKGMFGSDWVGLRNFKFLIESQDMAVVFRNTILYNVVFIILGLVVNLCVAILLDQVRSKLVLKTTQTMMFLPYFISWVVVSYMTTTILDYDNGALNRILMALGLEKTQWYMNPKPWPILLWVVNTWKGLGYGCLVYYGAIINIDSSIYEAAKIDGCNEWKRITKIVLPMLRPTIVIMLVLSVGGILSADFGLFYYIPDDQGLLRSTTDVIDTYLFRAMMFTGDMSTGAAIGLFRSAVTFILVIGANWCAKKLDPSYRVF